MEKVRRIWRALRVRSRVDLKRQLLQDRCDVKAGGAFLIRKGSFGAVKVFVSFCDGVQIKGS